MGSAYLCMIITTEQRLKLFSYEHFYHLDHRLQGYAIGYAI